MTELPDEAGMMAVVLSVVHQLLPSAIVHTYVDSDRTVFAAAHYMTPLGKPFRVVTSLKVREYETMDIDPYARARGRLKKSIDINKQAGQDTASATSIAADLYQTLRGQLT